MLRDVHLEVVEGEDLVLDGLELLVTLARQRRRGFDNDDDALHASLHGRQLGRFEIVRGQLVLVAAPEDNYAILIEANLIIHLGVLDIRIVALLGSLIDVVQMLARIDGNLLRRRTILSGDIVETELALHLITRHVHLVVGHDIATVLQHLVQRSVSAQDVCDPFVLCRLGSRFNLHVFSFIFNCV